MSRREVCAAHSVGAAVSPCRTTVVHPTTDDYVRETDCLSAGQLGGSLTETFGQVRSCRQLPLVETEPVVKAPAFDVA